MDSERRRELVQKNRIKNGYIGDAVFDDYSFKEAAAKRHGSDKYRIGEYNLHFVCERLGANYNSIVVHLARHPEKDAADYLISLGYNIREFLYEKA